MTHKKFKEHIKRIAELNKKLENHVTYYEENISNDFVQFVLEAKPRYFVFRSISYDYDKAVEMQKRISEHTKILLIHG